MSCKSIFVAALVQELHSKGHRTLIFSQSRVMLDIMGTELSRMELAFLRIDGTLSGAQREAILVDLLESSRAFCFALCQETPAGKSDAGTLTDSNIS